MKTEPDQALLQAAELARLGNRAARQAQDANRRKGIANWYSLNGRIVSDGGAVPATEPAATPTARSTAVRPAR
jgi:hypothetical protein